MQFSVHLYAHVSLVIVGSCCSLVADVAAEIYVVLRGLLRGVLRDRATSRVLGLLVWLYLKVEQTVRLRDQMLLLTFLVQLVLILLFRF